MSTIHQELSSFGIRIPTDASTGEVETNCPACLQKRRKKDGKPLVVTLPDGDWLCHHCGWRGNVAKGGDENDTNPWRWKSKSWRVPDYQASLSLPTSAATWLAERGIGQDVIERNRIGWGRAWSPISESWTHTMQFPYYRENEVVNIKHRGKSKSFWTDAGAEKTLYGLDHIDPATVIWTGGEIDKLSIEQAGFKSVVAGPDGCPPTEGDYGKHFEFLERIAKNLAAVCTFVLALPNDELGKKMEDELARRLGKERCMRIQWTEGCRDANDVLVKFGPDILRECIEDARPFPVKGIFEMIDVEDMFDVLYEHGLRPGDSTGWASLDEFYRPSGGQWDLITGIPGHGKTNFLDALLVNLSLNHGWKHAIFSPENQPIERHFASLVEKWAGAPFDVGGIPRMNPNTKDLGKTWLQEHFSIILPNDDDGNWTIDGILSLAKVLVYRRGIRGLVIDPWNELDHSRPGAMTETEHISKCLTKIRQFARQHDVHVWVVAHPAKMQKDPNGKYPVPTPYNVSGSAHFRNKADGAVAVYRNVGSDDDEICDIYIQKMRFRENGKVGRVSLRYDWTTRRFIDDVDQERRAKALNNDESHETAWYLKGR